MQREGQEDSKDKLVTAVANVDQADPGLGRRCMLSQVFFTPPTPTKKSGAGAKVARILEQAQSVMAAADVSTPLQVSLKSDFVAKDSFNVTLITWQE